MFSEHNDAEGEDLVVYQKKVEVEKGLGVMGITSLSWDHLDIYHFKRMNLKCLGGKRRKFNFISGGFLH